MIKPSFEVEVSEQESRRKAFRAEAGSNVKMAVDGKEVVLLDISETGVAFETDKPLSGVIEGVVIVFQTRKKYRLIPKLNVTFCDDGRCGAEFVGLSHKAHMALSELVVQLQKARIRHELEEAHQPTDV
ncbi:MAG: hypothetical protein CSA60_04135 [Neptuniibacter caesariensis]|uniref:PilZ domain-containing protein n=1 Tax=Neptuniibacter caesariensis TaxID=207954 RepID=A0A2G6JJM7_NEPCE|nr:MAG: hypothetical protein CSA60_04135 [Neptuniibacter caesariensis]